MRRIAIVGVLFVLMILLLGGIAHAQEQPQPVPPDQQVPPPGGQEPASGQVYFYLNGDLAPVVRDVAGGAQMAEFGMIELLKGPTDEEKSAGYITFIPAGVKLQYSTVKQDRSEYSVCLSNELMSMSEDPDQATKALEQIQKTLQEITGIDDIGITVAGQEMASTPQDAYEALGVKEKASRETQSGSSGGTWIIITIVIIIAALIVALLIYLFIYMPRRREATAAVASKGTQRNAKRAKK